MKRIIVFILLILIILLLGVGCNFKSEDIAPFLSKVQIEDHSFLSDWNELSIRNKISEDAKLAYFNYVFKDNGEIYDERMRIYESIDNGHISYTYTRGYNSSEEKNKVINWSKVKSNNLLQEDIISAKKFFSVVDSLINSGFFDTLKKRNFYVLHSFGERADLGMKGVYYMWSDKSIEHLGSVLPEEGYDDVYSLTVVGTNSPGQNSSDDDVKIVIFR